MTSDQGGGGQVLVTEGLSPSVLSGAQLSSQLLISVVSGLRGDQDTGTMTRAEPGKMFQWTLCARLLPDLVSSRSKYLMNLNKFSALENVSPLICARGGD